MLDSKREWKVSILLDSAKDISFFGLSDSSTVVLAKVSSVDSLSNLFSKSKDDDCGRKRRRDYTIISLSHQKFQDRQPRGILQ
jgi:hypothetical protein